MCLHVFLVYIKGNTQLFQYTLKETHNYFKSNPWTFDRSQAKPLGELQML